jgi:hypothetical protein
LPIVYTQLSYNLSQSWHFGDLATPSVSETSSQNWPILSQMVDIKTFSPDRPSHSKHSLRKLLSHRVGGFCSGRQCSRVRPNAATLSMRMDQIQITLNHLLIWAKEQQGQSDLQHLTLAHVFEFRIRRFEVRALTDALANTPNATGSGKSKASGYNIPHRLDSVKIVDFFGKTIASTEDEPIQTLALYCAKLRKSPSQIPEPILLNSAKL